MLKLILQFLQPVFGLIDKHIDNEQVREKLKAEIQKQMIEHYSAELEARKDIIVAEIGGESAAQRNWRPHLMYMIMFIIAYIIVVVPMVAAITGDNINIFTKDALAAVPVELWDLLTLGLGGYIFGRTGEKMIKTVAPALEAMAKPKPEQPQYNG